MKGRSSGVSILRRLLSEQRSNWPSFVGILFLSLLSTPLSLLAPVPLKIAVDSYIGSGSLPASLAVLLPDSLAPGSTGVLIFAAVLMIIVVVLSQLQMLGTGLLKTYTSEKLVLGYRTRLFPHAQRLSLSYHDEKGISDSTYRILYDTEAIPAVLIDGIIPFVTASFTLVAMFVVIFLLSFELALVALVVAPLLLLVSRPFARKLREQWHDVKELDTGALSLLQEALSAVRVVKAFGKEEREKERLVHLAREGMWARIRVAFTKGQFDAILSVTTVLGTVTVLGVGMLQVKAGTLTLGGLLMVMTYLTQLYGPLQAIVSQVANLQSSLASAERAMKLLDEAPEVAERPDARRLERAEGTVALRNVRFGYDESHVVLEDVSFEVPAGTRVGIAGETGAGKTTLVSLLTRLYDPVSGEILLDGVDIRDYRLADLRSQFAIVLQEPFLFSKSISENIAYARAGARGEEIQEAARMANAHEFIKALPRGYETLVGERGMRLSGGERQRVSLARAFLKDAPILILDEPTSSVDVKTEAAILEALERLMKGRTVFIIAHRLSTLKGSDVVLVVEKGRIARIASPRTESAIESLVLGEEPEDER